MTRWSPLIAASGRVLDLACGQGRHTRWLLNAGHEVWAVDRQTEALAQLPTDSSVLHLVCADLEQGAWPFEVGTSFDAIVVTNYLWRPLWPKLIDALSPGGLLIAETFAHGQQTIGRPSRAEFLLQPGELLSLCEPLRTIAYEDGFLDAPERFVQRIVAARQDVPTPDLTPRRWSLRPSSPEPGAATAELRGGAGLGHG